jgi:hypothetical protein
MTDENRRYVNGELVELIIKLSCWSPKAKVFYSINQWLTKAVGVISNVLGSEDYPSWAQVTLIRPEDGMAVQINGQLFAAGIKLSAGRGPYTGDLPAEYHDQLPTTEQCCFIPFVEDTLGVLVEGTPAMEKLTV